MIITPATDIAVDAYKPFLVDFLSTSVEYIPSKTAARADTIIPIIPKIIANDIYDW